MYIDTNGMAGCRSCGLGAVTYDADGMPVEDPDNTTWGAVSGGSTPKPTSSTVAINWINDHSTYLMIGAGAFLLFSMARGGR